MTCPYCRFEVDGTQKFCLRCGAPLGGKREPRYCLYCHTKINGYKKNCPRCGAPLSAMPTRPQPEGEYPASRAAQVGYEAYRAFSSMLRVFFGVYFLLLLSQSMISGLIGLTVGSAYNLVLPSMLRWAMLLMLVGAVLQFIFALFLQGRSWAAASLIVTGVLCLLGLVFMLVVRLPANIVDEQVFYARASRMACAVMLGMGVPLFQGALSFCRATYKSTALRFLLVEVVWFVLSILGLYLGVVLFAMGVRGVMLTFLGPIAALAVSLALNRRVFHAASKPVRIPEEYQSPGTPPGVS